MVGVLANTEMLYQPAVSLARVKGAKTIGIFTMTGLNELYFKAVHKSLINGAQDNKLQIVVDIGVSYAANRTAFVGDMKMIIEQLRQAKPDLVAGAIIDCTTFVQAMKETNYTAPAILLAGCLSDSAIAGEAGKYIYGPTQWDRRLNSRIFREDGTGTLHFFPATVSSLRFFCVSF